MANRNHMCQYGDCVKIVPPGEGVAITAAGWREKFCGWEHAALWLLAMAHRLDYHHNHDGRYLRALAELHAAKKQAVQQ